MSTGRMVQGLARPNTRKGDAGRVSAPPWQHYG